MKIFNLILLKVVSIQMRYTISFVSFSRWIHGIYLYLPILLPSKFNGKKNNDENGKRSTRAIMIELFPFDLVRKVQCAHIFYDDKHSFPPLRSFGFSICILQCLDVWGVAVTEARDGKTNKQTDEITLQAK